MERKSNHIETLIEKLEQSERDKIELSKSIQELNDCYSSKIEILHATIQAYECRIEGLLEGKKEQIDRELSSTQRYEDENKKLLNIIDQLYLAFDEEKNTLESIIKDKDEEIATITEQKQELLSKSQEREQKIDNLVRDHMIEIDELRRELRILKDEVIDGSIDESSIPHEINTESQITSIIEENYETQDSLAQSGPLKEIKDMNRKQSEEVSETRVKQLVYRSPDPNFHALKASN